MYIERFILTDREIERLEIFSLIKNSGQKADIRQITQYFNGSYQSIYAQYRTVIAEVAQLQKDTNTIKWPDINDYRGWLFDRSLVFNFLIEIQRDTHFDSAMFAMKHDVSQSTLRRRLRPLSVFLKKFGLRLRVSGSLVGDESIIQALYFNIFHDSGLAVRRYFDLKGDVYFVNQWLEATLMIAHNQINNSDLDNCRLWLELILMRQRKWHLFSVPLRSNLNTEERRFCKRLYEKLDISVTIAETLIRFGQMIFYVSPYFVTQTAMIAPTRSSAINRDFQRELYVVSAPIDFRLWTLDRHMRVIVQSSLNYILITGSLPLLPNFFGQSQDLNKIDSYAGIVEQFILAVNMKVLHRLNHSVSQLRILTEQVVMVFGTPGKTLQIVLMPDVYDQVAVDLKRLLGDAVQVDYYNVDASGIAFETIPDTPLVIVFDRLTDTVQKLQARKLRTIEWIYEVSLENNIRRITEFPLIKES